MKSLRTQNFTAYVGLEWADTKHDICLQAAGSDQREFACIAHQVAASMNGPGQSLQRRFGGPIAIALELAKGPIVSALRKYDFLVLFPINPLTLAKYRKLSRGKDDPSDAELALDPVSYCGSRTTADTHQRPVPGRLSQLSAATKTPADYGGIFTVWVTRLIETPSNALE